MKEMMNSIHSMDEFEAASSRSLSVFVFSADWCPDCRFIEPFMPDLIEQYSQFTFYYVDRDECLDICQSLHIMGIPSFVAFENGKEIARFASRFRKTRAEIDAYLASLTQGKGE